MAGWERTRQYQNHHLDSTRWDSVPYRANDIVITTSYKSGTTWTQWLVYSLVFLSQDDPPPFPLCTPWVDERLTTSLPDLVSLVEQQAHRRFLKSHLPADGLPFDERVKYVVVARDARDVFMSLVNHWSNYTDMIYQVMNTGNVGDDFPVWGGEIRDRWREWISRGWFEWESEGYPYWSNIYHTATYWPHRDLPNVLLVHYNDLQADLPGQITRLGDFLDIEVTPDAAQEIAAAAHIDEMRANATRDGDPLAMAFKGGSQAFFFKGTNGRWKDVLSADDIELYDTAKERVLEPAAVHWLEHGWLG